MQGGESAEAVNALAYTVGSAVVFAEGQHVPGTEAGKGLLTHELTHVVQQIGALPKTIYKELQVSHPNNASEKEAETLSDDSLQQILDDVRVPNKLPNPMWV